MDVKRQLQRIHQKKEPPVFSPENPTPIFEGQEVENERGVFFLREKIYSCQDVYAGLSFQKGEKLDSFLPSLPPYSREVGAGDLLFFDTETTGLAGGPGTLPFMVGIAYYRNKLFHVKQFLARDYHEEEALLFSLKKVLEDFEILISFNGKSFDVPLLKDRFILSRLAFPWQNFFHLDLIHLARRLWKLRIGGCSLKNLEEEILGFSREDDVEGALIPSLYFNYLQSRNGSLLTTIFQHNACDLLSMFFLIIAMGRTFTWPEEVGEGLDLYSLGRFYQQQGDTEQAIFFFSRSLRQGLSPRDAFQAEKALSLIYKKKEDFPQAVSLWEEMVKRGEPSLFPYLELAKYHEHRNRDLAQAHYYTTLALNRVRRQRALYQGSREWELVHRLNRINGKLTEGS